MTRLPREIDTGRRLTPSALSLSLTLTPVSTAAMTLPPEESVDLRQMVELYTPQGSAGVFRVQALDTTYTGQTQATLQHGICTLQDVLIPGEEEKTGSARELLTLLLAQQDPVWWQLGDVEIPDDESITWEYDHSNVLDGVLAVIERAGAYCLEYDQTTTPWTLHVRALTDEDACECRLNRNLNSLTVTADTSQLCTRLYVTGLAAPLDADTLPTWGPVVRTMTIDEDLGVELMEQAGRDYLETHKNPLLTVELDALELAQVTGEPFDRFRLGRMCRVALPKWQTTIRQRVIALNYPDVYATPELVTVTLANEAESATDSIASLIVDTTVLRNKLYTQGKNVNVIAETIDLLATRSELWEYVNETTGQITAVTARLSQAEVAIDGVNARVDLAASREEVTTIYNELDGEIESVVTRVTSAEVAIDGVNARVDLKANKDDVESSLSIQAGLIEANSDAIALKADQASLDLVNGRIDAQADEIALKANRIELQGYVKADELETELLYVLGSATAPVLSADTVSASSASIGYTSTDGLSVAGIAYSGTTLGLAITYDSFTYSDQQGGMHGITYVKGVSLTTGASSGVTVLGA